VAVEVPVSVPVEAPVIVAVASVPVPAAVSVVCDVIESVAVEVVAAVVVSVGGALPVSVPVPVPVLMEVDAPLPFGAPVPSSPMLAPEPLHAALKVPPRSARPARVAGDIRPNRRQEAIAIHPLRGCRRSGLMEGAESCHGRRRFFLASPSPASSALRRGSAGSPRA
jgi:hypothetical protein